MDKFININDLLKDVDAPNHYTERYKREVIDTLEGSLTKDEFVGFCKGNIIKYISRYQDKGGIQDLYKGKWYIDRIIKVEREAEDENNEDGRDDIE